MNVCVIVHRLGPYHVARLRAAGRQMRVTAIEISNIDPVYAWDEVMGPNGFARVALFRDVALAAQTSKRIRARMREVLSDANPDGVAIPGWIDGCASAALQWCSDEGVPAVLMSETTPWDHERRGWKEAIKKRIVRQFATALVGGASHVQYLKTLGMPEERIFLGYDAVDNDYFATRAAEVRARMSEVRIQVGLPQNYFLASARFIAKKNLPGLIEAYARYRNSEDRAPGTAAVALRLAPPDRSTSLSHSDLELQNDRGAPGSPAPWSLVLLGDGPLRPELTRLIAELGLQDSVVLPGFKQYAELPAYYALAGAFIHASTTEQWGLVVNEAMASGLPVLVSNRCGCATELVHEGVNGFTFDPNGVEQLAQLMRDVAAPGFPLARFGAESQRLIAEWGTERFATGMREAAAAAMAAPARPRRMTTRLLLAALTRKHSANEASSTT